MLYIVHWKSHAATDAGHIEVEAADEAEAKKLALERLKKHYEDERRDLGIEITSVMPKTTTA